MEPRYAQSQQQVQTLSQAQRQALKVLMLPALDLWDYLRTQQLENPLLEFTTPKGSPSEHGGKEESYGRFSIHEEYTRQLPSREGLSLAESLRDQIPYQELSARQTDLVEKIIASLDEDGYLRLEREKFMTACGCTAQEAESALVLVQRMEPAGVGARSLEECLLLQIDGDDPDSSELRILIMEHLEELLQGKLRSIAQAMGVSSARLEKDKEKLASLDPYPGRVFSQDATVYIQPDVIFERWEDTWRALVPDRFAGRIGISSTYSALLQTPPDPETGRYLEEKFRQANQLLYALGQRNGTLQGVATFILERQRGWLEGSGEKRPLSMEEVAAQLGVNVSTVSRAVKDKFAQTPRGLLPLRSFFVAGIRPAEAPMGKGISREQVKEALGRLIAEEDRKHPLSDAKLSAALEAQGFSISRRTVVKYREELGLPAAFERKEIPGGN